MKRLLHWFANRRRPDQTDASGYSWTLLSRFGLSVELAVIAYDDEPDDYRPFDHTSLWIALRGAYRMRDRRRSGEWYVDAPCVRLWRKDVPYNLTLPDAMSFEDTILDLPGWMEYGDVLFGTKYQAWVLSIRRL